MVLLSRFHSKESESRFREVVSTGTLIIPTIGQGNVDQMIMDVLIYSGLSSVVNSYLFHTQNHIVRVGEAYSSNLQSIVGVSAYGNDYTKNTSPALGMELYCSTDTSYAFLQIRSQPKDGYAPSFVEDLLGLVTEWGVKNILFISSADSTFYDISQIRDSLAYFTTSSDIRTQIGESIPFLNIMNSHVQGSGLLPLLSSGLKDSTISITSMIPLVNEGRNFFDAFMFTKRICSLLQMEVDATLRMPPSWSVIDPWLYNEDDFE